MNLLLSIIFSLSFCSIAEINTFPVGGKGFSIDASKRVSGRMASTGYLRGKIVLLADMDFADASYLEEFKSLQEIWNAYKSKNFVLIGSYRGDSRQKARVLLTENNFTFPVYEDILLEGNKKPSRGIYVFDIGGNVVFSGENSKHARAAAGAQIISSRVYTTVESYKKHIDLFLEILPGKAFNVLTRFKKDFPAEFSQYAQTYKDLAADENIVKLAKLEKICRQALDYDPATRRGKKPLSRERIGEVMQFYESLTTNKTDVIAQEAKNCIAELKWLQCTL
jgi:hypothetical protein